MKMTTVKEFRDNASKMLRSEEPIFITRNGKAAGVYIPLSAGDALPMELKRELFDKITQQIGEELAAKGVTEEQVLAEFEAARKARR